jgi:long-chain fatty acid transport protein
MKRLLCVLIAATASMFFCATHASAAGFALPEQSASAMGMSSAFVAQSDDASAVWYNPAGMTQLNGINVMAGAVFIYPTFSHDNSDGTTDTAARNIHVPALFYTTFKLDDRFSLGFGINNPFGLATNWSPTSETNQVAALTQLIVTEFNPNIAFKITDKLSIAAGVTYVYVDATLANIQALGGPFTTPAQLNGWGYGWGGNAGILYKITDNVSTGFSYRSRMKVDMTGNAWVVAIPGVFPGAFGNASSSITLPDLFTWGFSIKPSEKLTLNADLGYTMWSTFDTLIVTSNNPQLNNKSYPHQWRDVFDLRIGGQYKLTDNWKLRAGLQYDQNPVPDHYFETRVPDSDRYGVSIGTGYALGNLTVDVAYTYLLFETRNVANSYYGQTVNGTYNTDASVFGVSFAYKF